MLEFIKDIKMILFIFIIVLGVIVFGEKIPVNIKNISYTASNIIRQNLMFILPFLIFPFIVTSIAEMKTKGIYLISSILIMVTISNFISIMISYFVGKLWIPFLDFPFLEKLISRKESELLFDLRLEPLLNMEYTMILALILGLYIGITGTQFFDSYFQRYMNFSRGFFEKVFILILPVYILGTIIKTTNEIDFQSLFPIFGRMIFLILCTQIIYITLLYYIGSGRNIRRTIYSIKNAIRPCLVGFSTMSSVITMPVTLKAIEKNIPEDPSSARVIISTTVNCHDIGECISLPMIALTIYYLTNGSFPDFVTYILFASLVTLAQFSSVSIPGGSIIVMLPFLIKYLGFTNEMCSMIIFLSIVLDPLGTANNIFGNGAFAMIVYKIQNFLTQIWGRRTKEAS